MVEQTRLEDGDLETFRREWRILAERCGNPFATWEWVTAWWRYHHHGRELAVTAVRRRSGEVIGILPLYLTPSRRGNVLRFLGSGVTDEVGPVCAPEHRRAVGEAFARGLAGRHWDWHALFADGVVVEHEWASALPGPVHDLERAYVLPLAGADWPSYLASRSKNFRTELRKKRNRLERQHRVSFRLASDPNELDRDMGHLLRLHRARWGSDNSFEAPRDAFHRDFAAAALEQGWLRLRFLELDGEPVAASYDFAFGGALWGYEAGRDPRFDETGMVLLCEDLREAFAEGLREVRFLRGDEAYKARFTSHTTQLGAVALRRGRSALLHSAASIVRGSASRPAMLVAAFAHPGELVAL